MTGSRPRSNTRPEVKRIARNEVREVGKFDMTIFLVVLALVGIGVIMVFSASHMIAANRAVFGNNAYHFLQRNAMFASVGFVLMVITSFVNYDVVRRFSGIIYIIAVVLLIAVVGFGVAAGGAVRWFVIPGTGIQIQPSEMARAAVIFIVASLVEKFPDALKTWKGLFMISGFVGVIVVLIALPGGFSAMLITSAIGFSMIFIASPHFWRFVAMGGAGAAALGGFFAWDVLISGGFRGGRFVAWLDPFSDPLGVGFQTIQSLYAIASGGLFGLGIGQSRQASFVPEPHNDIIFAIIVEELGLLGAGLILTLFGILIWRGVIIALNAPDTFSSMTAMGIVFAFAYPAIINVAVVTNSIPNTGVNLPFISYGGTSLIVSMTLAGVLLNISRYAKRERSA